MIAHNIFLTLLCFHFFIIRRNKTSSSSCIFRVPDSDDYTNDSNTSRISISEDDSTDEEKTVASNSKKSSSDYETCESQENQTMIDQNVSDHDFWRVEQQDGPQGHPEQPVVTTSTK
ncbi:hypothetical protein GcC1_090021 [Golovinomyces cichoracearum]|uniref:Uncharacterized protein n=1 Tax=Golovinomyces cichoracearum TaxID=62708 RepID=A0A420IFI5_9PEZI|nr:hypothetical protein GcC1_090021 [Golovinomyces cichoracearum]